MWIQMTIKFVHLIYQKNVFSHQNHLNTWMKNHVVFLQIQYSLLQQINDCKVFYSVCNPLRFGDISLQERINQKNFEKLEAYYKSLKEKVPLECKSKMMNILHLWKSYNLINTCFTSHSLLLMRKWLLVILSITAFCKQCKPLFSCKEENSATGHVFMFSLNRSTMFSDTDWHKGITWNPGPECSHKEEEECGDIMDCWNGEQFLILNSSITTILFCLSWQGMHFLWPI